MIEREQILEVLEGYEKDKIKVGVIGSHSALDIADGAKAEGFKTVVVAQKGRHRTYAEYFKEKKTRDGLTKGFIDEVIVLLSTLALIGLRTSSLCPSLEAETF
ncbi:MAG: 5-formaminoimidazole-4-carboxamide-(beta)-D-ribofuranosyl 5-monophosphate synthetase [Thermococcaceae archaeon]|nr:5-formaminoimidazole-4-carboxamide-(beta)-D-ribofuranosyl 5-monophosphate synthetase [Thermococcaceae archaeon]